MQYINAAECAEIISEKMNIPLDDLVDIFAEIPTSDVVEVKRGHWIAPDMDIYKGYVDGECSICGYTDCFDESGFYNYCPSCGNDMREEKSNE